VELSDGTLVETRPIRPEDAEMEQRFVKSLSDRSRYFRFMNSVRELTPAMLMRFTQIDYDARWRSCGAREPDQDEEIAVARYVTNRTEERANSPWSSPTTAGEGSGGACSRPSSRWRARAAGNDDRACPRGKRPDASLVHQAGLPDRRASRRRRREARDPGPRRAGLIQASRATQRGQH